MKKNEYEIAKRLMQNPKNVEAAYEKLLVAMESGDFRAHYAIGTWYLHGHFFKKSVKKGISFIRKAADNGVAEAAFDLAVSYERGIGVVENSEIAASYYLRAFRCGDSDAAAELERIFYHGIGVQKNRRIAREFSDTSWRVEQANPEKIKARKV